MPRSISSGSDGRAVRVIKCLRLLQADCYSVDDLAVRFGISRRTVYRDLRLLAAADVPLMRRARDGCYHVAAPVAS